MDVFSNLQSLLNRILKFRVTHYFKSLIITIFIEYNKSFVKKPTFNKKKKTDRKNPAHWVKWVYTQANPAESPQRYESKSWVELWFFNRLWWPRIRSSCFPSPFSEVATQRPSCHFWWRAGGGHISPGQTPHTRPDD